MLAVAACPHAANTSSTKMKSWGGPRLSGRGSPVSAERRTRGMNLDGVSHTPYTENNLSCTTGSPVSRANWVHQKEAAAFAQPRNVEGASGADSETAC